jgi:hypothetical protein
MRCSRDGGMTHRQITLILFEDMINGEIRSEQWRGKNEWAHEPTGDTGI